MSDVPTVPCETCGGYGVMDGLEPCPDNCQPELIGSLSGPSIPLERRAILKAWEAGWEAHEAFMACAPKEGSAELLAKAWAAREERALPTPREASEAFLTRLESMTSDPDVLAAVAKVRAENAEES